MIDIGAIRLHQHEFRAECNDTEPNSGAIAATGFALHHDIDDLIREVDALRSGIRTLREYADKTWDYWNNDQDSKVGKRLACMAGGMTGHYSAEIDAVLELAKEPTP